MAEDDDLLQLLSTLPAGKRQPNLLFAAVQYMAGIDQTPRSFASFKRFVVDHADDVFDVIAHRRTQTNDRAAAPRSCRRSGWLVSRWR